MKKKFKVVMVLLAILGIIILLVYVGNKNTDPYFTKKDLSEISFKKVKLIKDLSTEEKNTLYKDILSELNKRKFYYYHTVTFKKIIYDDNMYIYFYIDDDYNSLFECLHTSSNTIGYLGDELNPAYESQETGRTYLEIMNPKQFAEEKQIEKENEEAKTTPDGTEGVRIDPKDGVSE